MRQHEVLTRAGLSEDVIQELTNKHMIEVIGSDYVICDPDILYNVLLLCLDKNVDPAPLLIPPFITGQENNLDMLYRYMTYEDYSMCGEMIEHIMTTVPSRGLQLLKSKFASYRDNLVYILKDETYKNDVITSGLHRLERKLLREIEMYDYVNFVDTLEKLSKIYPYVQSTPFFANAYSLLGAISDMTNDHQMISKDDPQAYTGDLSNIINCLIVSGDYYRTEEVINRGLKYNPDSIEWRIYQKLIEQVMFINKKNTDAYKMRAIIDSSIAGDVNEVFPRETFPSITREQLKEIDNTEIAEYDSHDYYAEYEEAYFAEHDYKKAKEMLLKHMKQEVINGQTQSYDYLIDELNILLRNEANGVNMDLYNAASKEAFRCMQEEDYKTAGQYIVKMANYLPEKTPRIYTMLAECYKKLGYNDKAYQYYTMAIEGTIAPYDIEQMMEVCFKVKDYDSVISCFNRYNFYEPYTNVKVYYMAAAAYYQMGMYDDCEEQLGICTDILDADSNLPIEFKEEREAIKRGRNGKPGDFNVDNYIDYTVTPEEEQMMEFLDENYEEASRLISILEDEKKPAALSTKIEYILTVAKLLFQACRYDDGLELVYGIDPYLEESIISDEDQKKYVRIANNLRTL